MKICPVCHKKAQVGGGYSNRTRATKFNPTGRLRKNPNLQWATLPTRPGGQAGGRIKVCASCLKSNCHLTLAR